MKSQITYTISQIEQKLRFKKYLRCMNCGRFLATFTVGLTGGKIMVLCKCSQKNTFAFN